MKFILGLSLFAVTMFGGLFVSQTNHFDDQKMACRLAEGNGSVLHSSIGMPIGYECMRLHLVLKFRNGRYI